MGLKAETPEIAVKCDHEECVERAVVQIGVGFACAEHAVFLVQDILNLCKRHFIKTSRRLF